jgi:hypothetical protein
MKLETTLSNVGRAIDTAITAVHTRTPLLIQSGRTRLAGLLVNASNKVRPKVKNEPTDGRPAQHEAPEETGREILQDQNLSTIEEATP